MLEEVVIFFRAVSHQLYGNSNNYYLVRSLGIQYLMHNPEQFIERNTDYSWQGYLNNMSCEGTWADAIIIQAVANCLNLSIHIAESNESFTPVTVVQPVNVTTACTNIYIGQKTTNQTTSIKLTPSCSNEHISHSYYLTPIKPSFQDLSIRPLEQTVKFVCSSLNVTNPKNLKAFKMHPQPNKLFQAYQDQLIFRLQVLSTLFKISDNHSTSA